MNYEFIKNSMMKDIEGGLEVNQFIINERFDCKDDICTYTIFIKTNENSNITVLQSTYDVKNNKKTCKSITTSISDFSSNIQGLYENCTDKVNVKKLLESKFNKDLHEIYRGGGFNTLHEEYGKNNYKHIFFDAKGLYIYDYKYDGIDIISSNVKIDNTDIKLILEKSDNLLSILE